LLRVQLAQERYRETHGQYAERLDELRGAPPGRSEAGLYRVELQRHGPDSYDATAIAGAEQQRDTPCPLLRLRVEGAITQRQPDARCWTS
jgi:type IV pilus assembly protein PilE